MSKTPTDIRSLARSHTGTAIKTLVGVMNQAKAPPAARVAAANAILDRGWGKPNQSLDVKETGRLEKMTSEERHARITELNIKLGYVKDPNHSAKYKSGAGKKALRIA